MRRGKTLAWGGSLALGVLLFLALANQPLAHATDLCLPPVHQYRFVVARVPATGPGPLGDGTVYPGLTFPNGAQAGQIYQDQSQHKLNLVIFGPDGLTPASAIWQDFTAHVQYNYNYQTQACVKSAFKVTEGQTCIARNATEMESFAYEFDFHVDSYVAATSPGHSVEAWMEQNSTSKPVFSLRRDGTNTTQIRFYNFRTSPIDPSQFIPPASCPP
jgi:hypothetical protein